MKHSAELVTQTIEQDQKITLWKEQVRATASGGLLSMVRKRPYLPEGRSSVLTAEQDAGASRTGTSSAVSADSDAQQSRLPARLSLPLYPPSRGAVLLVHGFAQNRYAWHLEQRSFVNYLVDGGYDVFNLELRGHGRSRELGSKHPKSFSEYSDEDFPAAVDAALAASQQKKLFVIGHSLGAGVIYAAAPKLASKLRGIVTLAGVFQYGKGLPLLRALGIPMRGLMKLLAPSGIPFRSHAIARVLTLPMAAPLLHTAQLLPWELGSIEPPILREYLHRSFDRTSFHIVDDLFGWMRNQQFGGERDLAPAFYSLDLPLLVVSADRDQFNHPDGVRPAFDGSMSRDKTYLELSPSTANGHYGHADMIVGRLAPTNVWPRLRDWLDAR